MSAEVSTISYVSIGNGYLESMQSVAMNPKSRRSCCEKAPPPILREIVAECLGTFILMVFGQGSVAQFVLSEGKTGSSDQIRWSWGLGVTFGVYTAGGVSGAHLNPAVTLTMCLVRKLPWKKLAPYLLGQYLGAFFASCVVYVVYYDALTSFKGGNQTIETAGIFATYPQGYLSMWNGLADQIFGTSLLLFLILALTDPDNMSPNKGYLPLAIGLVVTAIGMTFGLNCGYAINPARDLGPRLFTLVAGWGSQVFSYNDYKWFWIPVLGPHIGGILGGLVYMSFIQMKSPFVGYCSQHPDDVSDDKSQLDINSSEAQPNQQYESIPSPNSLEISPM